jgi:signal transduction histidine kinase
MKPNSHASDAPLDAFRAIEPVLRADAGEKAAQALAQGLRRLVPGAPLYACLLNESVGLCDEVGSTESRSGKALREVLKRAAPGGSLSIAVSRSDKLPGQALALQPLQAGGHGFGTLAILLAKATDDGRALRTLLEGFAERVCRAWAERQEGEARRDLEEQLAEETRRGDIGEMVGPALHEVGNFINTVFLTLAVLERKVPAELRGDFSGLRKQGHAVAALAGQIQQTRRASAGPSLDLHLAIREALRLLQSDGLAAGSAVQRRAGVDSGAPVPANPGVVIESNFKPGELMVRGRSDVKRLCRFLLHNAIAAVGSAGKVAISTDCVASWAVLRIIDGGPTLNEEQTHHFWDTNENLARPGTSALELATCWSLCKRLAGKLEVANAAEGGVVVILRLPLAT